ncbi:MAG: hypothetical protein J7L71_00210, partial [Spirochaetaceae bacterium]|nr:hypothetical protein [Spirochaetaceae bacterium]
MTDQAEKIRIGLFIFILLFSMFYIFYRISLDNEEFPYTKKGILNYRPLTFSENGKLLLKGEWEFYWKHFYFPQDFIVGNEYSLPGREFIDFPRSWEKVYSRNQTDQTNSSFGYATYRLRLTGLSKRVKYALMVPAINSSYTLWINGMRMLNSGMPGVSSKLSIEDGRPGSVSFSTDSGNVSIILHVSNFSHIRGGPLQYMFFGRNTEVVSFIADKTIFAGMGIIFSLLMAVFLIFLDINYRMYYKETFLILLFATLAVRISVSDSMLLLRLFPNISWEIIQKLKYISTYCIGPLLLLVEMEQYKEKSSAAAGYSLAGVFLILVAIIIVSTRYFYSSLNYLFDIYELLCFIYIGYLLFNAIRSKKNLYLLNTIAVSLFFVLFINIRLFIEGFLPSDKVSLSAVMNIIFNDQYYTQSYTPIFIFLSFLPYMSIFIFYIFSKIDYIILFQKEDASEITQNKSELFEKLKLTEREVEIVEALIKGYS